MTRWNRETGTNVEAPKVDAFIADVVGVYKKHGMSIGHEDHHGAFEVYGQVLPGAVEWLEGAHIAAGYHLGGDPKAIALPPRTRNIQRDATPDRIATALWYLIVLDGVLLALATWQDFWRGLLPIGGCTIIAYGVYYLITGRTDKTRGKDNRAKFH